MAGQPRIAVQVSCSNGKLGASMQIIGNTIPVTHSSSYDAETIIGPQTALVP